MSLKDKVVELTCLLFKNFNNTRTDVDAVIDFIRTFISESYNPFLLNLINCSLDKAISEEAKQKINNIFLAHKDPFKAVSNERRMTLYKNMGLYTEPEEHVIVHDYIYKQDANKLTIDSKEIKIKRIPIMDSLVKLLGVKGIFEATLMYMNELQEQNSDECIVSNFIQGDL